MRCGGHVRERCQPLQRQGQVGAALGVRECMDLIHDHPARRRAAPRAPRRQQQVERFGRGHEDVRRAACRRRAAHPRACRRCACRRAPRGSGSAQPSGGQRDACERRTQVAVHVVDERLERRHVEHAEAARGSSGGGSVSSRSRHHRNAESVLPLPVGAQMSVCCPAAIAGQPCAWGAVGSAKDARTRRAWPAERGERLWLIGPAHACHGERSVPLRGRISTSVLGRVTASDPATRPRVAGRVAMSSARVTNRR